MAILGSIVEPFVRTVLDARSNLALGCAIGSKLVGDKAFRHKTMSFHQSVKQSFGRRLVAATLKNFVKHDPNLINRTPQPEFLPLIFTTTSSKCQISPGVDCRRRKPHAIDGPNFTTHRRIVSYETSIPRSRNISSTSRRLRLKRQYSQTTYSIISVGKPWPLKPGKFLCLVMFSV